MEIKTDQIIMILLAIVVVYFLFFSNTNPDKKNPAKIEAFESTDAPIDESIVRMHYLNKEKILYELVKEAFNKLSKEQSQENKDELKNLYEKFGEHLLNSPEINYELIVQLMAMKNDPTFVVIPDMVQFLEITITSLLFKYLNQKNEYASKEGHRYLAVTGYVSEHLLPAYIKAKEKQAETIKVTPIPQNGETKIESTST